MVITTGILRIGFSPVSYFQYFSYYIYHHIALHNGMHGYLLIMLMDAGHCTCIIIHVLSVIVHASLSISPCMCKHVLS